MDHELTLLSPQEQRQHTNQKMCQEEHEALHTQFGSLRASVCPSWSSTYIWLWGAEVGVRTQQ